MRAAKFGGGWPQASLKQSIKRVAGDNPVVTTEGGKTIYTNPANGKKVIHDGGGDYFRVQEPRIQSRRNFCDPDGNPIAANRTEIGHGGRPRETGKSYDEYQQETHFRNSDPKDL